MAIGIKKLIGNSKRGLAKSSEGAAIIEFALVTPMLFLLLIGIIEVSLILFTYSVMEGATNIGSRIGKTGFKAADASSREEYIRREITRLSGGYLDPALLQITILSYGNFDNIGKPEDCITSRCGAGVAGTDYVDINCNGSWDADQGKSSAGGKKAVVLYRMTYPWKLFTPLMGYVFGDRSGIYKINAIATIKNEDFGGNSGGC